MKQYAASTLKRKAAKSSCLVCLDDKLIVKGLRCYRCGKQIFSDPSSIIENEPDGVLWSCEICGEVNNKGIPLVMIERSGLEECPVSEDEDTPF